MAYDDIKHASKDLATSIIGYVHDSEAQHEIDVKRPLMQSDATNGSSKRSHMFVSSDFVINLSASYRIHSE